ncbi:MAG: glycosyltransferase family 2 protein [Candidatus Omnitrophota bacterium]
MAKEKILVLIPAFNESERIAAVIEGVGKYLPEADILVVDDGSGDRTAEVSRKAGARVVGLPFNLGVGAALQTGYKFAVSHDYQYLIQLDGDGQHDPSFLPFFLQSIQTSGRDLIIGSRFLSEERYEGSVTRLAGIRFFACLASVLTGQRLTDPTSGYRAIRRAVLEFCIQDLYSFDYPDADFLLVLHRAGFSMKEIPVNMNPRTGGRSQHRGLGPLSYIFKIMLSIFVTLLRKRPVR